MKRHLLLELTYKDTDNGINEQDMAEAINRAVDETYAYAEGKLKALIGQVYGLRLLTEDEPV